MVDNFTACCYFHYYTASIAMSFKIMAQHCFVKGFKKKEKCMLKNTEINNNRLLHLDAE